MSKLDEKLVKKAKDAARKIMNNKELMGRINKDIRTSKINKIKRNI